MKKLIVTIFMLSSFSYLGAFAFEGYIPQKAPIFRGGNEVGNGGLVVELEGSTQPLLLDYAEYLNQNEISELSTGDHTNFVLPADQSIYDFAADLLMVGIELEPTYVANVLKKIELEIRLFPAYAFYYDQENELTSDFRLPRIHRNVRDRMNQVFVCVGQGQSRAIKYKIDARCWNRLDLRQQVYLIIHEAVYSFLLDSRKIHPKNDAHVVREFVASLIGKIESQNLNERGRVFWNLKKIKLIRSLKI